MFGQPQQQPQQAQPAQPQQQQLLPVQQQAPQSEMEIVINDFHKAYSDRVVVETTQGKVCLPNKQCRFKHIVYDDIVAGSASAAPRKPSEVEQRRWEEAERDNPDPNHLAPVVLVGVGDLTKRQKNQAERLGYVKSTLASCQAVIANLEKRTQQRMLQLETLRKRQADAAMRLAAVMRKLEFLRCLQQPWTRGEEEVYQRIRALLMRTQAAQSALQSTIQRLRAIEDSERSDAQWTRRQGDASSSSSSSSSTSLVPAQSQSKLGSSGVWSDDEAAAIQDVLQQQGDGLSRLVEVLARDMRDIQILRRGLQAVKTSSF